MCGKISAMPREIDYGPPSEIVGAFLKLRVGRQQLPPPGEEQPESTWLSLYHLYAAWVAWCTARDIDYGSVRDFVRQLKAHGVFPGQTAPGDSLRGNQYRGLELIEQ